MSAPSRTTLFNKVHKVLKKQSYKVVAADPQRPVMEHLLFAACLENAQYGAAEEAYAALEHSFFDWNETRVSTVRELAEVMSGLPDPARSAGNLRRLLYSVFELRYAFDLEDLRKMNLGPAVDILRKLEGSNNYIVAYVTQAALGGHAIPVDDGVLQAFHILGLASDKDVENRQTPGLERAVAKSKGAEFASLLHQLSADFTAAPNSPTIRKILLEIDPSVKDNLPGSRRAAKSGGASAKAPKKSAAKQPAKKSAPSPKKPSASAKTPAAKKTSPAGKATAKQAKVAPKRASGSTAKGKASKGKARAEKPAVKKKSAKTKTASERTKAKKSAEKKKSGASKLSKKKPR